MFIPSARNDIGTEWLYVLRMRFGWPFTRMVGHFDSMKLAKHTTNAKHEYLGIWGHAPQESFEI